MLSWLAKKMIARNMESANAGDIGPTLKMDAEDVRFRFPGDNRWAGEIEGKEELEGWLRRFADTGLQIEPDEVILQGFPWRQTICIRGNVHLDDEGKRVYANRYVIWGHIRWGLLRDYEVYEDTEESRRLDVYLTNAGR